jgi:hypothetical protein
MLTIKLTIHEARALLLAIGNSIDNEDDARSIVGARRMAAAYRGSAKISKALYSRHGPIPRRRGGR